MPSDPSAETPPPPPGAASGATTAGSPRRAISCPECGTPIERDEQFAHFHVCPSCQSSIVIDEKAASVAGKMATLAPPTGPLSVGAIGTIGRTPFRVLGRVRYGHESGYWDEWAVLLEEERLAWISEDGDEFSLETHRDLPSGRLHHKEVQPGQRIRLGKVEYHVDEVGVAICEGGEGQLPFPIVPDERVPFLDLTSDESFATIEFDGDNVRLFQGQVIDRRSIHVQVGGGNADTLSSERAADGERRERIAKQAGRQTAIDCHNCGGALGLPAEGATSLDCEYCGTEIDLSLDRAPCPECDRTVPIHGNETPVFLTCQGCRAQFQWDRSGTAVALSALTDRKKPRIPFQIGQKARFEGETFRLIGHLRAEERDDGDVYRTDEFLLFSPGAGYRWLTLESGHWTYGRAVNDRPRVTPISKPRTKFKCRGMNWRVYEGGKSELTWVDGEFPWVATVGDQTRYLDTICPPYLLSGEFSKTEAEWTLAEYLPREKVAAAFSVEPKKLPRSSGVAPAQPYPERPFLSKSTWVMLAFFVLQLVLIGWAAGRGKQVERYSLSFSDYSQETITEPFTVSKAPCLCSLSLSSQVNNSWVYLDFLLIDAEDRVLHEFSETISYYHGVEGGERWSEGSRNKKVAFALNDPGEYRLIVRGESGSAEVSRSSGPAVEIGVREGIVLKRWFILLAVGSALWMIAIWGHRASFEARRWKSFEDD